MSIICWILAGSELCYFAPGWPDGINAGLR
jgi:hypothetical protein